MKVEIWGGGCKLRNERRDQKAKTKVRTGMSIYYKREGNGRSRAHKVTKVMNVEDPADLCMPRSPAHVSLGILRRGSAFSSCRVLPSAL